MQASSVGISIAEGMFASAPDGNDPRSANASDDAVRTAQAAQSKAFKLAKRTIKLSSKNSERLRRASVNGTEKRIADEKASFDEKAPYAASDGSGPESANALNDAAHSGKDGSIQKPKTELKANGVENEDVGRALHRAPANNIATTGKGASDAPESGIERNAKLDSLQKRKNQAVSRSIAKGSEGGAAATVAASATTVAEAPVAIAKGVVDGVARAYDYLASIPSSSESTNPLGAIAIFFLPLLAAPFLCIALIAALGGGVGADAAINWFFSNASTDISEIEIATATTLRSAGYGSIQIAAILGNAYVDTGCDATYFYKPEHSPVYQVTYGMFAYTHTYLVCDSPKANLKDGTCDLCSYIRWCATNGCPPGNVYSQLYWTFSKDAGWQSRGAWWTLWDASDDYAGTVRAVSPNAQLDSSWEDFANEINLASAVYSWMACYSHPTVRDCDYPARLERALEIFAAIAPSGWSYQNGHYYYYNDDGSIRTNDWAVYEGKYYYLDDEGKPVVDGWVYYEGDYYYVDSNGNPVIDGWVYTDGKWYCIDSNGNPIIDGWAYIDGKYYYLDSNGNPVTDGWTYSGGEWYYLDSNGNPVKNSWVKYNGKYYYVDSSGNPVISDWVKYNGKYYYLNSSGNPVTDAWVKHNGKYYYLNSSGNPVVSDWVKYNGNYYYMDSSGNPVTDTWWQADDGTWYRFDSDGVCHPA